jgi:hypothetical protein
MWRFQVKIDSYSMSGMYCVHNNQFQHGWDVSWSKLSVSARLEWNVLWSLLAVSVCLECVVVKIASFSMPGMCCVKNRQFQHVWNVSS